MKKNILILVAIIVSTSFLFACFLNEGEKEKVVLNLTYNLLKTNHYKNVVFDDELSNKIYDKYIETLDYSKRFFLKSDIKKLSKNRDKIDDQIRDGDLGFFDLSYQLLKKNQELVKNYPEEILENPFEFNSNDEILLEPEEFEFCKNEKDLHKYWTKLLKFEVLQEIDSYLLKQEKAEQKSDTTFEYKNFEQIEEDARKKVLKNYNDYFDRAAKLDEVDYFSIFINSITLSVDPHSSYFAPKSKEDFDIRMAGELEGIGATLTQKSSEIKIANVVIGGAAWKQGELEDGDIILKVRQQDEEDAVSVVDMRLDDAVRLIRGKKGTTVILTVKKIDGTIKEISIIRDKIVLEDTYVRTIIISDSASNSKVAYLKLSSFYIDFQNQNGRKCSNDFKNELLKLENENIDGIIIDLRDNGGGSLSEVVNIAGFFIPKGPIVQVRQRNGKVTQLKDRDASVVFDGNVVIMTNQFSASASEIFAAALQDYNRAVVFGTPQTLGKGTVQQMYDLDRVSRVAANLKPLGALKMTIQKFYRINGGSTQIKGVQSDISFSTTYTYLEMNEASFDNVLEWDKIPALSYNLWETPYILDSLELWSNLRMKSDSAFIYTDNYAKYLKKEEELSSISLNLDTYRNNIEIKRKKRNRYNKKTKEKIPVIFSYLNEDKALMQTDTLIKYRYDNWSKKLTKDYELNEAFNIVVDMTKFEK